MKLKVALASSKLGGLVMLAGLSAPASAQFNVAQYPLYVQQPVKPAFIMAVDDSGSMKFETLFPGRDGQGFWGGGSFFIQDGSGYRLRTQDDPFILGSYHHLVPSTNGPLDTNRHSVPPLDQFGFARAPAFNASWYNPEVDYGPWKDANGNEYVDSTPSDARYDPRNTGPRFNLTQDILDRSDDADNEYLTINNGGFPFSFSATTTNPITLEAGWQVRNVQDSTQSCATSAGNITLPRSSSGWLTITSTRVTTNCASFHIQRTSPGRISHVNEMFTIPRGTVLPAGTQYYRFALRRLNGDGDYNDIVGGRGESSLDPGNNARADSCGGLGADVMDRDRWVTLTSAITVNDNTYTGCRVGIRYFMPTYYLPADAALPDSYNPVFRTLAVDACGPGCNLYRYEIKPAHYTSGAVYAQQIQNFANWYTYYGNRNRAMIAGMTRAMSDVTFMRVGFMQINDTRCSGGGYGCYSDVTMRDLEVQSARNSLYNDMLTLPASGSTPNRWAVDAIGQQFMRPPAAPGAVNPPEPFLAEEDGGACQVNGAMLFTDGYSNQNGPSVGNVDNGMGSPFRDGHSDTLADVATKYYLNSLQPGFANQAGIRVSAACAGSPEPWVDCIEHPHINFYGVTLGAKGEAFGVTHAIDPNDWTEGFTNPPTWPPRQNDDPTTVDDIWHAAVNTRGRYINAQTPEQITQAMRDVLLEVSSRARPAGGVAASGSRIGNGFLVYVPEYFADDWTGDLKAYRLSSSGALVTPAVWSAAEELESVGFNSRPIFSVVDGSLVPFTVSGLGGSSTAATRLDLNATDYATYGSGVGVEQIVNYLRGDQSLETTSGGNLRARRSPIGDILNSQPELTIAQAFPYTQLTSSEGGGVSGSGSYGEFVRAKRSRAPVIFVGANDGMLHAIDSREAGGNILFSIIPNSVLPILKELPKRSYSHRYYVDGTPSQADIRVGGQWRTYVFVGNGAGGKSVMALDATNASTGFSASDFKWEFQNVNLGHVMSSPRAGLLEGGDWVALVGNGPNGANNDARLFVLDAATGAIKQQIVAAGGSPTAPNGLTSATPIDTDFNGKVDTIYAGDLRGNVWKFSVSGNSVSVGNGGQPLFVATDSNGERQPITGSVTAGLHHQAGQMVFVGTGKYFEVGDNAGGASAQVQSFYGLWDKNDNSAIGGRSELQEQTLGETESGGQTYRTVSANPVDWNNQRGWFVDLRVGSNGNGERFIGRARVLVGSVLFTTYTTQGDICNPGGTSRAYMLDLLTGNGDLPTEGCPNCGGTTVSTEGAPVSQPPVVVESNGFGDRFGIDSGDGGDPLRDDDGNIINPAAEEGCAVNIGLILAQGKRGIKELSCGRQSWRQLQ